MLGSSFYGRNSLLNWFIYTGKSTLAGGVDYLESVKRIRIMFQAGDLFVYLHLYKNKFSSKYHCLRVCLCAWLWSKLCQIFLSIVTKKNVILFLIKESWRVKKIREWLVHNCDIKLALLLLHPPPPSFHLYRAWI
jgi:hypothetical protein